MDDYFNKEDPSSSAHAQIQPTKCFLASNICEESAGVVNEVHCITSAQTPEELNKVLTYHAIDSSLATHTGMPYIIIYIVIYGCYKCS